MLNPILNPILYVPISRRLFALSLFLQALKELLATSTESKKKSNLVELVTMPNGKISRESLTEFFELQGCKVEAKTGGSKVYYGS